MAPERSYLGAHPFLAPSHCSRGQPGREQWLAQREAFRKRAVAPEPRFSGLPAFHCWQGSPEISPIVPTSEQTLACAGEGAAASAASRSPALSEESLPAGLVSTWKAGLGRLAFGGERAGLVTLRHMVRTPLRCEPKGVSARPRARGALPARGSEAAWALPHSLPAGSAFPSSKEE